MNVSQKCQYALRALFELARRHGSNAGPAPISEIAEIQAIPPRFLELILGELKHGGYVESRRGAQGGYLLAGTPEKLSVGDIIRFVDGPLEPVKCFGKQEKDCPLQGNCAFIGLWQRATKAVADVYDTTSLADLVREARDADLAVDFCI